MSSSTMSPKEQEELNKLENEAFKELGQIIAIAYQVQDIEYINNLISAWERKYQKLLSNPDFKRKFKKILDETYDELVRYILSQIKLKEEKVINNQRKAIHELYSLLKDNYDLDTLKEKIKKWETKYPYNSFLKMYQKRIDSIKREKNLQDYAFSQEEAFKDLYYGVVNRSGTIEEIKEYLHNWEEKYHINDKFTIDNFIKYQSEVKRYTSEEFLISISKKEDCILDIIEPTVEDSSLDSQKAAYKSLISLVNSGADINEIFKWVYKNNTIKFNDKYRELILTATHLEYSPKYLKSLTLPDIDLSKPTLSIDEYNKIDDIKRYAIISYFNLLLPQNEAVSNNYFTNHIKTLYNQLEHEKSINIIDSFKDEITLLSNTTSESSTVSISKNEETITVSPLETPSENKEAVIVETLKTPFESKEAVIVETLKTPSESKEAVIVETLKTPSENEEAVIVETLETPSENEEAVIIETLETPSENEEAVIVDSLESPSKNEEIIIIKPLENNSNNEFLNSSNEENIDYPTIVSLSPTFFEIINNYSIQANLIQKANTKFSEKTLFRKNISKSQTKTMNQSE